jgi:NAD(P)-dependent dehydrogenase (short-subunit alcohol dehydrogenase family)/acyl dehydratase
METRDAIVRAVGDLRVGLSAGFEREITEADVAEFARNSGDRNPLHVDAEYARSTTLGARVVHGAYQVALASAMAGMYLPGRDSFLVSYHAQFSRPLYFPCRVAVSGEITSWDPESLRGNLKVIVTELPARVVSSQIHVGFTCHEASRKTTNPSPSRVWSVPAADAPIVLVTGASGGIGSGLLAELARDYSLLAIVNRRTLPADLLDGRRVVQLRVDLNDPDSISRVEEMLEERRLYGIVHAAWPALLQGGLLSVSRQALEQQLEFGIFRTIDLARLLASKAENEGARLVVLGSTAGSQKPSLNLAAYSLAKSSLEHTVKLLAPELALKKITVNAVCPSFLPVGMNVQTNERRRLTAKAAVPLGRLCEISDILGAVRYLFSKDASFLTGQTIVLSGGRL